MRLIDADLLIERIKRNDDLPWNLDKVMQVAFESCVRHSPTAYDVDKVVEPLENRAGFTDAKANAPSIPDERAYQYGAARDAYLSAIEIVEKGGIE